MRRGTGIIANVVSFAWAGKACGIMGMITIVWPKGKMKITKKMAMNYLKNSNEGRPTVVVFVRERAGEVILNISSRSG